MVTLRQALQMLHEAEEEYRAIEKKLMDQNGGMMDAKTSDDADLVKASRKVERLGKAFYAMPHIQPFLEAWMVDLKWGDSNPFHEKDQKKEDLPIQDINVTEQQVEELEKDISLLEKNPQAFTAKTAGPLFQTVEQFLSEHGFKVSDRGGGPSGGHIGYSCTDSEKDRLLFLLYSKFNKAIDKDLIVPTIAWFKPKLALYHHDMQHWVDSSKEGEE